jgi:hypothetical protein
MVLGDGDVGESIEEWGIEATEVDDLLGYDVLDFLRILGGKTGSKVS